MDLKCVFLIFVLFSERHCTSVSFGPESFQRDPLPRDLPARFAIGYNDGILEVYSIKYERELGTYGIHVCFKIFKRILFF